RRAPPPRRRHAGRWRLARQRAGELRRAAARVARQELLRQRGGGKGDRLRRHARRHPSRRERIRLCVCESRGMNPGLVVKLRPTGPWRIGPDSGARSEVDFLYHSDSLYSAVTSALARFGSLDEWLDATARNGAPAVCFSSCFPFVEEIGFVIPPRTLWPPAAPALLAARLRWKSARFVPLGIVPALLTGQALDENDWTIDGPTGCLVPAGR